MLAYQAHVGQSCANTNINPTQQESSLFSQEDPSFSSFLPHQCKTPKKSEKEKQMKKGYITNREGLPLFPPIKYTMISQCGPFSLRTMLEGPWLYKMAIPTPMV